VPVFVSGYLTSFLRKTVGLCSRRRVENTDASTLFNCSRRWNNARQPAFPLRLTKGSRGSLRLPLSERTLRSACVKGKLRALKSRSYRVLNALAEALTMHQSMYPPKELCCNEVKTKSSVKAHLGLWPVVHKCVEPCV
jgi:hypothetical protein